MFSPTVWAPYPVILLIGCSDHSSKTTMVAGILNEEGLSQMKTKHLTVEKGPLTKTKRRLNDHIITYVCFVYIVMCFLISCNQFILTICYRPNSKHIMEPKP